MPEKKEQNKFTIQFNPADPAHRQTIDILNQQGRRKAQFIVNAVQHYLHCPETPDIPQPAPVDIHTIEDIVRRIVEEQKKPALKNQEPVKAQSSSPQTEGYRPYNSRIQERLNRHLFSLCKYQYGHLYYGSSSYKPNLYAADGA